MPRQKEPLTEKAPVTRRGFLRLSVIAAGSAIAAACQEPLIDSIGTSTVDPSPAPSVKLSLSGGDQDAWTWEKQVQVRVLEGNCERMVVRVNGQEFEAQPEGQDFIAGIPLSPGENEVSAVCLRPTGEEVPSDPVIYTAR